MNVTEANPTLLYAGIAVTAVGALITISLAILLIFLIKYCKENTEEEIYYMREEKRSFR